MDEASITLISEQIFTVRGHAVMLDSDLAALYGVETKVLNQAVSRNQDRFPEDFCFRLHAEEWEILKSQIVTSSDENDDKAALRSQNVTIKNAGRGRHRKYIPLVFTEYGALMASTILRSKEAVAMSVYIMRAFVRMREAIASNQEILKRLAEIDHNLIIHDSALRDIYQKILPLLDPPPDTPKKRRLGFDSAVD